MADQITIKVHGIAEAVERLKRYQVAKTEAVKIVLKRHAFNIERGAKEGVLVDTSRLKTSISVNWAGSGMSQGRITKPAQSGDGVHQPDGPKELVYVVGSNVIYAPFNEWGTSKWEGRAFLFPAYFMYEGEIVKDIGKVFKTEMRLA